MRPGFRQSMAWLHTWSGLLLGWLLFAVFLTGTIAYFRTEVTWWMQPELHGAGLARQSTEALAGRAVARLQAVAPDAERWMIRLPETTPGTLGIFWREPQQEARRWPSETLDPATGEVLTPRETAGGTFLYRFHFELYGLPRTWGRWIVGVATFAMFVAIISGIITHKKIFSDFFTFRPAKGQRSWLDAHAVTAVLALPYHIMITYSGLILLAGTLIPWNLGDIRHGHGPEPAATSLPPAQGVDTAALTALLRDAEARFTQPVGRISVEHPGLADMTVEVTAERGTSLAVSSGGPAGGAETLTYAGVTGQLVEEDGHASAVTGPEVLNNALGALHRARFADAPLRWLFFLSGVGGTVMVATGMVLWTVKRARRLPASPGRKVVEALNIGGMAGLMVAVAVYFWANRMIPAALPGRVDWEIGALFGAWLLLLLHPLVRPARRAWVEQLSLGALLFAGLPVLNALTSTASLPVAIATGDWAVAGFDLVALTTGLALALTAWKVARHQSAPAPRRQGADQDMDAAMAVQGGAGE